MDNISQFNELVKIIKSSYIKNARFKDELLLALRRKTGNDNLGILCNIIIENEISTNPIVTKM